MAVGRKKLHVQQREAASRFRKNNPGNKRPAQDARLKLKSSSIKVKKSGVNNEVKLYTSHFDARNKIAAKKQPQKTASARGGARGGGTAKITPKKNGTQTGNGRNGTQSVHRGNGTTPRGANNNNNNKKRPAAKPITMTNKATTSSGKLGHRESTFTGKSLRISTTNEFAAKESQKERKATVHGKMLSVTARNRGSLKKETPPKKKPIHKTIKMDNSKWIGPSPVKRTTPEPIAPPPSSSSSSSSKKSLSAKVVISNLHPNVTQEDIMELFGAIGHLRDGRIKNVGTAEVVYRNSEDAFAAYTKYHGRNLDGQPMILKITTAEETVHGLGATSSSSSSRSSKYSATPSPSSSSSHYTSSSTNSSTTTKPVVFTVKL